MYQKGIDIIDNIYYNAYDFINENTSISLSLLLLKFIVNIREFMIHSIVLNIYNYIN